MARAPRLLLVLTALVCAACPGRSETGSSSVDAPDGAAAGLERGPARRASASAESSRSSSTPDVAQLVAVTRIQANESQPCERTCGRVGDCLLADADRELHASGLELACLDLCVHSPRDAQPRAALLACEQQSSCGELLGCAERSWGELSVARGAPNIQGVNAAANICTESCRWMYACMVSATPPGDAVLDPYVEEMIQSCEVACEELETSELSQHSKLLDCLHEHCGYAEQCWGY